MYADDSVGFSDKPIDLEVPEEMERIKINEEKSGYIKYNGQQLKPLKFLGLEVFRDFLRAHTRKGSRLQLTAREEALCELYSEVHDKCNALAAEDAIDLVVQKYYEYKPTQEGNS